jgi:hypothetical protein
VQRFHTQMEAVSQFNRMNTFSYIRWTDHNGRAKAVRGLIEAANKEAVRESVLASLSADERMNFLGIEVYPLHLS